jgi:predicted nucleotidyltransferase
MPERTGIESALATIAHDLSAADKRFALIGGIAISVRAEVRFTRDVDVAVAVVDDAEAEELVYTLSNSGYRPVASVEQEARKRLATIRLLSPHRIKVDLLFASTGIEIETVRRAENVFLPGVGDIPIAKAEELLAMKVLSMTDTRLQDRIDAQHLILYNPELDLDRVRENLHLITARGFHRRQNLNAKLDALLSVKVAP